MNYIIMFLVGFVSFAVSVFTFAQIIGSFQHASVRGIKLTLTTVLINTAIIAISIFCVLTWLQTYKYAALIGAIIGLFLLPKNIE